MSKVHIGDQLDNIFEKEGVRDGQFDGVLTDAVKHSYEDETEAYSGFLYGDSKRRFGNGELVRTSYVVKETKVGNYIDVQTRNSRYKVYLK